MVCKQYNTPPKKQENVLWYFLVAGGLLKSMSKVCKNWTARRALNRTSQKMAASGHKKKVPVPC